MLKLSYLIPTILFTLPIWAQHEPIRISATLEIYNPEKQLISTLSFEGEQKKNIVANSTNPTNLKCEASGKFENVVLAPNEKQKSVHAFLEIVCIEGDQKHKSRIGKLLLPTENFKSFSKNVYLHKSQPKAVLKIKDISQ